MKQANWKQVTKRRGLGLGVMVAGLLVLFMPLFVGIWTIALLGIVFIGAGLFQFVEVLRSRDQTTSLLSYLAGGVTTLLGLVLFISPNLVLSGLLIAVIFFLLLDGGSKIVGAYKQAGQDRWWNLFNGLFNILLAIIVWYFISAHLGLVAIGVVLGLRLLVEGWTMFFLPEKAFETPGTEPDLRYHPDLRLSLEPSDSIKEMQEAILASEAATASQNMVWCLSFLAIFFAIHLLRTDAQWSIIGFISPFAAVIGDAVVALVLGIILVIPWRLLFRRLTRGVERTAWRRVNHLREAGREPTPGERMMRFWLRARMRFAIVNRETRSSLNHTLWRLMRIGLPVTAIIIAINSIWGFSWYFNSENWASGVWQGITQKRVDVWRQRMAQDVERAALAAGVPADKVFAVNPEGISNDGDFSFIVIGDTGEGDPSQMSLREQLIAASNRDRVKFLVLSSDVIYPDGKMKDYETNFYLPFHGFQKPIYAIPGNHDWFDADEGFNANFLDRDSAILALKARLLADVRTRAITTDERFDQMTKEAQRLREYYRIKNGLQRGPFFEFTTAGFTLIAIDTGILRTVDPYESAWLKQALTRAGNNFKMAVIGHPFIVAGADTSVNDPAFREIFETLKQFGVDIAMAGDTHDFEFYKEHYNFQGKQGDMLHFVNGGGGAYLSIGTALGFPEKPVVSDYAFLSPH